MANEKVGNDKAFLDWMSTFEFDVAGFPLQAAWNAGRTYDQDVISDLTAKLTECQAREAKLRAALQEAVDGMGGSYAIWSITAKEALALPHDDIALRERIADALADALHPEFGYEWREPDGIIWKALREHRRKVLLETARRLDPDDAVSGSYRSWLRRVAEE